MYCPSCGQEVSSEQDYCINCGADLPVDDLQTHNEKTNIRETEQKTPNTITIEHKNKDGSKQYNIDNIAYLRNNINKVTFVGIIIILMPVVIGVLGALQTKYVEAFIISGCIGAIVLAIILFRSNKTKIGTVASNQKYVGNFDQLNKTIKSGHDESITVSGTDSNIATIREYQYTFFFNNIVSIEKTKITPSIFLIYSIFAVGMTPFFIISVEFGNNPIPTILGFFIVILFIKFLYDIYPYAVEVEIRGGEKQKFTMTPNDSERVISEFQ